MQYFDNINIWTIFEKKLVEIKFWEIFVQYLDNV